MKKLLIFLIGALVSFASIAQTPVEFTRKLRLGTVIDSSQYATQPGFWLGATGIRYSENGIKYSLRTLGSASSLTFSNGLTKTGYNVKWGGTLSEPTDIEMGTHRVRIRVDTDNVFQLEGVVSGGGVQFDTDGTGNEKLTLSSFNNIGGDQLSLTLNPTGYAGTLGAFFTDGRSTKKGIQYSASGYVTDDRSLTDKGYVDAAIVSIGGSNYWKLAGTSTRTGAATITGSNTLLIERQDIGTIRGYLNIAGTAGTNSNITVESVGTTSDKYAHFETFSGATLSSIFMESRQTSGITGQSFTLSHNIGTWEAFNGDINIKTSAGGTADDVQISSIDALSLSSIASGTNSLVIDGTGSLITLSGTNTFRANADYSANYTARSFTDKAYVDSKIVTASNGLVKSGNDIQLGGPLTGDATIVGDTDSERIEFNIGNTGGSYSSIFSMGAGQYTTIGFGYEILSVETAVANTVSGFKGVGFSTRLGVFDFGVPDTDKIYIEALADVSDIGTLRIVDNRSSKKGIEYGASGYVTSDRSLTDRGYVLGTKTFTGIQTFTNSASEAGLILGSTAGNPSAPTNGGAWYNSTSNYYGFRINGANHIGVTSLAGTTTNRIQYGGATSTSIIDNANLTYSGGILTSVPNATTEGLNVGSFAGDPSAPTNGGVWYNSSTNQFMNRQNGANSIFIRVGSAGLTTTRVAYANGNGTITGDAELTYDGTTNILTSGSYVGTSLANNSGGVTLSGSTTVGITASGGSSTMAFSTNGGIFSFTGGTSSTTTSIISASGTFNPSSGSVNRAAFSLTPTWNTTSTYSGNVYDLDVNSTNTSLTGATHYGLRVTSGSILFGGTTIAAATTRMQVNGISGGIIMRLADDGGTTKYTMNNLGVGSQSLSTVTATTVANSFSAGFNPTSGTNTYTVYEMNPTWNTTGSYSGTLRGLYVNSTNTSLTGATWNAIETTSGNTVIGGTGRLHFASSAADRKIVLHDAFVNNDYEFYGFGVVASGIKYQVATTSTDHIFYAATSSSASNEVFRVKGNGVIQIPTTPTNDNSNTEILTRDGSGNIETRAASSFASGITNTAASDEVMKSNGTNAVPSGLFSTTAGNLTMGTGLTGASRTISATGTASNVGLIINGKGTGTIDVGSDVVIRNASVFTNNTILYPETISTTSSGSPAVGIGVGRRYQIETSSGNYEYGATTEAVTTNVGAGTEAVDYVIKTMAAGATADEKFRVTSLGAINVNRTITGGGTTGNQTINKVSGSVNFAASATTLTVTNSLVASTSIVFAVVRTNDTTATIKNVVASSGSFVITLTAAATAETSVGFFVLN